MSVRPYINFDGRMIPYPLVTAGDYLEARYGMTEYEVKNFVDEHREQYSMLNAIIAMKQSCFLLRHTSYSCQSLPDDLCEYKKELVARYNESYDDPFDEDFYENYRNGLSIVVNHIKDVDLSSIKMLIAVIYENPLDFPEKFVIRIFDMDKATNIVLLRDSLEECRKECIDGCLHTIIPREDDDDDCIVESWV